MADFHKKILSVILSEIDNVVDPCWQENYARYELINRSLRNRFL